MLLCSLLLSTGTVTADEFVGYVAEQWGIELSNNIEEVTSSHITTDDVRTTEDSAWPEFSCVYACVTDEEKSTFKNFRMNALIEAQSWKTPRVRNAIPEDLIVSIIGGAQAPYIAAGAQKGIFVADVASCTLHGGINDRMNWFTNDAVFAFSNCGSEKGIPVCPGVNDMDASNGRTTGNNPNNAAAGNGIEDRKNNDVFGNNGNSNTADDKECSTICIEWLTADKSTDMDDNGGPGNTTIAAKTIDEAPTDIIVGMVINTDIDFANTTMKISHRIMYADGNKLRT
jgi:hypothetical protein